MAEFNNRRKRKVCQLCAGKTVDYKERAKEGSPEDSVIFYGSYKNNEHMIYAQSDTSLSADVQSLVGVNMLFLRLLLQVQDID